MGVTVCKLTCAAARGMTSGMTVRKLKRVAMMGVTVCKLTCTMKRGVTVCKTTHLATGGVTMCKTYTCCDEGRDSM